MSQIMRLDKYISSQRSDLSRSQVKELCKKGKVTVDGEIVKKSDAKLDADKAVVCVNGEAISYRRHIYIMLNKPQGVVCSTRDGLSPTVLSLIPPHLQRDGLFPAGRLDKDTEGFVLITDDGDFAHRILSPKNHIPKTYYVELEKPYDDSYGEKFENGITLRTGEQCMSAQFIPTDDKKKCYVVLHEGMFHQVKKMFEALSNKVVFLKRTRMGNLDLDENLVLGECLELMHKDVCKIAPLFDGGF